MKNKEQIFSTVLLAAQWRKVSEMDTFPITEALTQNFRSKEIKEK